MIGDSITWAGDGDYWRQYLLEQLPNLAFIGTHSARLGYSHAGEGGNSTTDVLARMTDIPDCPYYHLLIGTNDRNGRTDAEQQVLAKACAERILKIVDELLQKPHASKVFLGSILPCQVETHARDRKNIMVNAILRPQVRKRFPDGKVVWVEYENPIRAIRNWGPIIQLHPTKTGYQLIATILAQTLRDELGLPPPGQVPQVKPIRGSGVQVTNLWGDSGTSQAIVAGWYTMSFDVANASPGASITLIGEGADPKQTARLTFAIPPDSSGKRLTWQAMTGYVGCGYTTGRFKLATDKCTITRVLFEKRRPSGLASLYGTRTYLDATSPILPGELVER